MEELIRKREKIDDKNVVVELYYRLNFDADRTCGYTKIFQASIDQSEDEEPYEIYMELYECGLKSEEAVRRFEKVIEDVKTGKIDVEI
jgi:repressor of nif and glnA expression